mmetsp:Transcript_32314/g.86578  ORF Transcript_32314/g.86578 Transcript_32314/m.86578 type:complete len:260 (-) Transcript_32314:161-940(-)
MNSLNHARKPLPIEFDFHPISLGHMHRWVTKIGLRHVPHTDAALKNAHWTGLRQWRWTCHPPRRRNTWPGNTLHVHCCFHRTEMAEVMAEVVLKIQRWSLGRLLFHHGPVRHNHCARHLLVDQENGRDRFAVRHNIHAKQTPLQRKLLDLSIVHLPARAGRDQQTDDFVSEVGGHRELLADASQRPGDHTAPLYAVGADRPLPLSVVRGFLRQIHALSEPLEKRLQFCGGVLLPSGSHTAWNQTGTVMDASVPERRTQG